MVDEDLNFSIDKLSKTLLSYSTDLLSFIHLNCRSNLRNYDEIQLLLNTIKYSFKVIALSETWLSDESTPSNIFSDYTFVGCNRNKKRGGGVGFCIYKNVEYVLRPDLNL